MEKSERGSAPKKQGALNCFLRALHSNRLGESLVLKGLISTQDLCSALRKQKETQKPLGQIFIEEQLISRSQLRFFLWRQTALRGLATALLFGATLTHMPGKKAYAGMNDGIILASASQAFSKVNRYPALMGTSEKRDRNLKAFTKWTSMFNRFDRELDNSRNVEMVKDWQKDLNKFQNLSMKQMANKVNALVNQKRYIVDQKNWGKSDYWATPVEFLKRGGDCEDFAIAKYTALRSLGFPEERLRVAIVQDLQKNIPHAVLVAYTDEGAYILDNQIKRLVDAERSDRYKPIFSINRQAWWLHSKQQNSRTIVASAE